MRIGQIGLSLGMGWEKGNNLIDVGESRDQSHNPEWGVKTEKMVPRSPVRGDGNEGHVLVASLHVTKDSVVDLEPQVAVDR